MPGRSRCRGKAYRRTRHIAPRTLLSLGVCIFCFGAALLLWKAASKPGGTTGESHTGFRPQVGLAPYRIAVDAGHGGADPGASGVVQESQMTAATAEALFALLEADPNYIPLHSRADYDTTAQPSERAEMICAQSPDLLISIHGNSAPEGTAAFGFECYPTVPGRTWHEESFYFAKLLAQKMQLAGASLRGNGGVRYIYYQGEAKLLLETNHTETRAERSFTLLEDVNCPAVLAEQCFVTNEADVERFGSAEGCQRTAQAYYEAICAYFGTEPFAVITGK